MSSAPWSTPFLTTDQNGSEACPWVTTAILMSFRSAPPPPWVPPCSSAQATSANRAVKSNRIQPPNLDLLITLLSLEAPPATFLLPRRQSVAHLHRTSDNRTGRRSVSERSAAIATRSASSASRAVQGFPASPRARRRK